ncbi:hypothetical protein [Methylomusa anaerophila]|uniref:Translocation protein TolB n=1 Tax=Methylomusa anaerophila TaxID=1930071 RepID=A0A348ALN6_9FIRM|nr:hypothetical protein [Methylomusa anaerophila]BBB91984.1 hypothetical protein MAMMFC1_02669 [Methylomusa anaerophila]
MIITESMQNLFNHYFWRLFQFYLLANIGWHLYIAVTHDPGAFYIGWIIPLFFIGLFVQLFISTVRPSQARYYYCVLFLLFFAGWQIWLSYLMLNELRLFLLSLLSGFLVLLYLNHRRFGVKQRRALLSLFSAVLVAIPANYLGYEVLIYKQQPAYSEWAEFAETHRAMGTFEFNWLNESAIVGRFEMPNEHNDLSPLRVFDLNTGQLTIIDIGGGKSSVSRHGNWVGYIRLIDKPKKSVQYIRQEMPDGPKEIMLEAESFGLGSFRLLSPDGQKVFFRGSFNKGIPSPKVVYWPWEQTSWVADIKVAWLPDSQAILIAQRDESTGYKLQLNVYSLDLKVIGSIPVGEEITLIKDLKISPDGQMLYAQTMHRYDVSLDYYNLREPEKGWRTAVSHLVHDWDVGAGGKLVYANTPYSSGYFDFLNPRALATRGIWLFNPEDGNVVRLTTHPDELPKFSPSGNQIAFRRHYQSPSSQYAIPSDLIIIKKTGSSN